MSPFTGGEQATRFRRYDANVGITTPELISDMLETLANLITEFYKEDPKEAVYALNSFTKTMKFDPAFAMGVMEIPFFVLGALSGDEREGVLAELSAVCMKHAEMADQNINPPHTDMGRLETGCC